MTTRLAISVGCVLAGIAAVFWLIDRGEQRAEGTDHVGVLVPLQHRAMDEMVAGLREELERTAGNRRVRLDVQNAHGDPHIQRAILGRFAHGGADAVVAIGTAAAQASVQLLITDRMGQRPTPVVALDVADSFAPSDNHPVTGTYEADATSTWTFARRLFPQVDTITLVHSLDPKSHAQATRLARQARVDKVNLQLLVAQQPTDLYTVGGLVNSESGLVLILKDHLVASGVGPLVQLAQQRRIPLVTCDDGTVRGGAAFALGTAERDIGVAGAHLVQRILAGQSARDLPMQPLQKRVLFVNKAAAQQQGVQPRRLEQTARDLGYPIQFVSQTAGSP
ncbi:MAG: ABC transporter substrate binding protein [Myxococcota bacterium]